MELAKRFEGKKFMWDGNEYTGREEAEKKASEFTGKGFEVRILEEDGKFYIYTRRVSKFGEGENKSQGG